MVGIVTTALSLLALAGCAVILTQDNQFFEDLERELEDSNSVRVESLFSPVRWPIPT